MCFWDHKRCALRLWAHFSLLEVLIPTPFHFILLELRQCPYITIIFQWDSRMFVKEVWSEIIRPDNWTWPRVITMRADDWAICARGHIRTFGSNSNRELYKIWAWACLHVDRDFACPPFGLFQNDLTKQRGSKAQTTWFRYAFDWGVMKYMGTDVLHNALPDWGIELHDRLTIRTC